MYRPDLTPAQHVARREALAQIGRGQDYGLGFAAIDRDILGPLNRQFIDGRRIDGPGFGVLVNKVRGILEGYGPPRLDEYRRPPTRTRPKGEEHEFTSLLRSFGNPDIGQSGYELVGIRLHLSRRRVGYSYEANGIFITRHLLDRSIERGLASWTGRLAEVEDAVLDRMGLANVWRHALDAGMTVDPRIALPCGSGLIYGIMDRRDTYPQSGALVIGEKRIDHTTSDPNPVVQHPRRASSSMTDIVLRTAVDEDSLTLGQCDLRDALIRFCGRHSDLLRDVRRTTLWRKAVIEPAVPYGEIQAAMDACASDLLDLLGRPEAQEALRGRKPEPDEPEADEGLGPRMR